MKLFDWLKSQKMTVSAAARGVGLLGANPMRTLDRIMRGERSADSDMIAAIEALTHGAVTAQDMHETRLEWLRINRPEKFVAAPGEQAVHSDA